jgi:hypothetical protein
MDKLSKALERLLIAVSILCIHSWIFKWIWNEVATRQGLLPITWLEAIGWLILGRALTGAGDIVSTLKKSANSNK